MQSEIDPGHCYFYYESAGGRWKVKGAEKMMFDFAEEKDKHEFLQELEMKEKMENAVSLWKNFSLIWECSQFGCWKTAILN